MAQTGNKFAQPHWMTTHHFWTSQSFTHTYGMMTRKNGCEKMAPTCTVGGVKWRMGVRVNPLFPPKIGYIRYLAFVSTWGYIHIRFWIHMKISEALATSDLAVPLHCSHLMPRDQTLVRTTFNTNKNNLIQFIKWILYLRYVTILDNKISILLKNLCEINHDIDLFWALYLPHYQNKHYQLLPCYSWLLCLFFW